MNSQFTKEVMKIRRELQNPKNGGEAPSTSLLSSTIGRRRRRRRRSRGLEYRYIASICGKNRESK